MNLYFPHLCDPACFPSDARVLYPDIRANKREITRLCQRGVPEAQLAAACCDLSPVHPISPTDRDMVRAAVRSMSSCSPKPTGCCHPDGPALCRRRPLLLQMEERNDKNTWRSPSQSADSEAAIGGERTPVTIRSRAPSAPGLLWWEQRQERAAGHQARGGCLAGDRGGRTWHYY